MHTQEVYHLDTKYPVHEIDRYLRVYTDSSQTLTVNHILKDTSSLYLKGNELPGYFHGQKLLWGKLRLRTNDSLKGWTLHFIDIFAGAPAWVKGNGKVDIYAFVNEALIFHKKAGYGYSKNERDISENWVLNRIRMDDFPLHKTVTLIIKAEGSKFGYPPFFRLNIRGPSQPFYHELNQFNTSFFIFMFGVTFIILLYHVLQYMYLKDRIFLFFSLWVFVCCMTVLMATGAILDTVHRFGFVFWMFFSNSVYFLFWFFGRSFIQSKTKFPLLDKFILGLALFMILEIFVVILLVVFTSARPSFLAVGLHAEIHVFTNIAALILSVVIATRKDNFARYFGIGASIGLMLLLYGSVWAAGWIGYPGFDAHSWGIFAQIVIFSFGIAYRRQVLNKANEAERLEAQKTYAEMQRVKDLDEVKTKFFANISHEFRTPLSLISGPLQFAKKSKTSENGDVVLSKKSVDIISNNADRLQHLIDQLLELSKLESGNIHLSLKQGGLIQFVKSIVFSFESMAERSNISLITSFPEEIDIAFYDRDKLQKVLSNFMSNAFKFTSKGGMVNFSLRYDDSHYTIVISDTGIGMSAEEMKHVFERFYRSESTETKGSGIGLALTKEIVDIHNGQININSRKREGTTFKVRLPYTMEHLPKDIAMVVDSNTVEYSETTIEDFLDESKVNTKVISSKSSDKLILIVEDNSDLRDFITDILGENYQLLLAEDGLQGERMAIEHIPDLILSDVMMPKKDGYEMCHSLKLNTKTSHIPIILLTAKAGHNNKMEGLNQGADVYLTKPFHAEELLVNIQNLITNRERQWNYFKASDLTSVENLELSNLDDQFLQKSAAFIKENLDNEGLSVEDLAAAVGFSRSQYHRKLKALVNKSANQLIVEIRLNEAHKMLKQKEGSVSEIAYSVGYTNLSYFTKSFKDKFGKLPSKV